MTDKLTYKLISLPLTEKSAAALKAGDTVLITGTLFTARDAAHKRICESLAEGREPPFELSGASIYYTGPCPPKDGQAIGSCGPTTSGRMDAYTPLLLKRGVKAIIGKGARNAEVTKAFKEFGAVYFAAIGGAGALYSRCVKECSLVAYPELLSEAVRKLYVENFPAVVALDIYGGNLYDSLIT